MDYKIRTISEEEESLLQDFLYQAVFVPEGVPAPPKSIISQPELQIYITGFGTKKDDIGLVAEVNKKAVGAVWVRIMNDYGHIDNATPSIACLLYTSSPMSLPFQWQAEAEEMYEYSPVTPKIRQTVQEDLKKALLKPTPEELSRGCLLYTSLKPWWWARECLTE